MNLLNEADKEYLLNSIREIEDFPKPGIKFKDITTLLNNEKAFNLLLDHLVERYKETSIDYIAGIESRGFIFRRSTCGTSSHTFCSYSKTWQTPLYNH